MIYNIQVLRALAALVVVWAHLRELFPAIENHPNIPSGLAGVDLFFVISGFIMVVSTQDRHERPVQFLRKRLVRVVPLYYLFTALVVAITLVAPSLLNSSTSSPVDLVQSLAFIPFYKSPDRIYPTYYLGWTLNYEMFFYLIFAIGLLFRGAGRVVFAASVIVILLGAGVLGGDRLLASAPLFAVTRPIMLDFIMGMGIGLASGGLGQLGQRRPALVGIALAVGCVWFVIGPDLPSLSSVTTVIAPSTDTALTYGIGAALIVAAAVAFEKAGRVVRNRFFLLLGDASYSLYLSHFFVVGVAKVAANRLGLSVTERIPLALGTVASCVVVAILIYQWVERPMHLYLTGRLRLRRRSIV